MNVKERYKQITRLGSGDRKNVKQSARSTIRSSIGLEPQKKKFDLRSVDWVSVGPKLSGYLILLVIGGVGFYLSAGKQIIAARLIFAPLIPVTTGLSLVSPEASSIATELADYARRAPYLLLMFGELNSVFFMAIAQSLPARIVKTKRGEHNATVWICYAWALVAAIIAIISNVTVTAVHLPELQQAIVLTWLETLMPPFAALFVGWTAEGMWHIWSSELKKHDEVRSKWFEWNDDPSTHPDWEKALQDAIMARLYAQPGNQVLLENDRMLRKYAYNIERDEILDVLGIMDTREVNDTDDENPTSPHFAVSRGGEADTSSSLSSNSNEPISYSNNLQIQSETHVAG